MKTLALTLAVLVGGGGKIEWSRDVEKSLAEAKKAGKPVMLYFTADW